jgi:hypothetical protein
MRQLFIDSRDRVAGTPSNFTIQFPQTLVFESNHRMRIDNARIPMAIPTIQTGVNDTLIVSVKNASNVYVNYTVTLPQGNYDGVTLASSLQYVLNAATSSWTVSYDTANIRLTIQCVASFTVVGGLFGAQLMAHSYSNTSNVYQFNYVPMVSVDQIFLCSPQFATMDTFGPKGSNDTLMAIPVTGVYGSVANASMSNNVYIDVPNMTTQTLSFQLKDRNGTSLSIIPDFSFVLTID